MIEEDEAARDLEEAKRHAAKLRAGVLKFIIFPGVAAMVVGQILNMILPRSMEGSFIHSLMLWGYGLGFLALILGGFLMFIFIPRGHHGYERQHIDGAKVKRLDKPQSDEPRLPIGHARMPLDAEPVHTLIEGATGTGKTQILKGMVDFIRARGDTVVVVDDNYDLHKAFGRADDIVLSAFDETSPGWLPQNEIRTPADWSALAQSLIGDGQGEAAQWHQMAKALFAAVGRGYSRIAADAGEPFDHMEFFHLLTQASSEDLAPFIKGTAAASLGVNDKALNNVRMTFFSTLKFWEYLRPGDFSLRGWVEQGGNRPSIFMPYTRRSLEESKTLMSCWLDQIITTACDMGEDRENRVWIIIDELSGLGEISGLLTAVTLLRKTGFRVVAGIQNYEQVEKIYGATGAKTITNNMVNKVILRASDAASAERQSKLIGDARFRIFKASESRNEGKVGVSRSMEEKVERIVLPSELTNLAPLNAFVIFSGDPVTYRTPIPIYAGPDQKAVEAVEEPKALPAPPPLPTLQQKALQADLRASGPITPTNTGGEGPQVWTKVDELLKRVGGEGFEGERFRQQVIERLGWVKGQTHEKFADAHERARQLLSRTLDRNEIERQSKQKEDVE